MSIYATSLRRVVTFIMGVAVGMFLLSGVASAAPNENAQGANSGGGREAHTSANPENTEPQPASNADYSGKGANQHGSYDSTRDGSPSGNGNGKGEAKGKPCAGCVGKADNKNPKGQYPNGSDHNAGYECDRNHGIGRSNPAHTGCTVTAVSGDTEENSDSDGTNDSDGDPADSGSDVDVESNDLSKPECGDGPMTVDANNDGVIDSADCAVVLGSGFDRAAPSQSTGGNGRFVLASAGDPVVLGNSITRGLAALPSTGLGLTGLVALASMLLAAGFVLVRKVGFAGQ